MGNYFRTISSFSKNDHVNRWIAVCRHTLWQVRKIFNIFPCDIDLGNFVIRITDRSVANGVGAMINALRYYDPNNMHFLEEIFQSRMCTCFYDVGANIGIYSLLVASSSKEARICAFEPHPDTFSLLKANVLLNKYEGRIRCFQTALGEEEGQITFTDEPGSPVNQVVAEDREGLAVKTIRVDIHKGDTFYQETGIYPEVLKIDVEGFEDHVLHGFKTSLSAVKVILIECQDISKTAGILCNEFGFLGPFKMDHLSRRLVSDPDFSYEDWMFISAGFLTPLSKWGFDCSHAKITRQGKA